jgi:hypothetical protein
MPQAPTTAPSGARLDDHPGQPTDDATCPSRLKARGVVLESVSIGPQPDPRCQVVEAIRLSSLSMGKGPPVEFPDRPTIACATADAFTRFVADLLVPLAKGTYGTPVVAVWTGPGLDCRARDHIFGGKLSAHGLGLAVDVAEMKLADGRRLGVGTPHDVADEGFARAAQAAGCGYFHTALGPGSDAYHRTHWHFDIELRGAKGDTKYCH